MPMSGKILGSEAEANIWSKIFTVDHERCFRHFRYTPYAAERNAYTLSIGINKMNLGYTEKCLSRLETVPPRRAP